MSIKEQLQGQVNYHAEEIGNYTLLMKAVKEIGLEDADFYLDSGTSDYSTTPVDYTPYIRLTPKHVAGIAVGMNSHGPTLAITDTTPTLGDAARILLPKVGRWDKSFDEKANLLKLTAKFMGIKIVLQDTPPETCTVEKIEDEIEIPEQVISAHTEKKIRYVLKGDCDPLLSARTTQAESVGDVKVKEEEDGAF